MQGPTLHPSGVNSDYNFYRNAGYTNSSFPRAIQVFFGDHETKSSVNKAFLYMFIV